MRLYLDSCVLIYALDGAQQLQQRTLQQLERHTQADWVISDLVRCSALGRAIRDRLCSGASRPVNGYLTP